MNYISPELPFTGTTIEDKNGPRTLMTVSEAAKFLNIKISRIRKAIFRREITYVKIGNLVRFRYTDLIDFIQSNCIPTIH